MKASSPPDFQALRQYAPPADLLKGRVILVTGAADGIGKAVAQAYARHGAKTILLDRNKRALEFLRAELVAEGDAEPLVVPMDLATATTADYRTLAGTIGEAFGRLDGLLNNAGWIGALTPLEHADPQLWGKVMAVNLVAPFFLTQWCMPLLKSAEDPVLGFSLHETRRAYWGAYGIAKAGLEAFLHIVADEYHAGSMCPVRVFGVDPGPVSTAERRRHYPGELPGTHPEPESIVGPYLYGMGAEARGFTDFILARNA